MAVSKTADYNLPGLDVTVNDGGLRISPVVSGTKLTIVGTTTNALLPINEPVQLMDAKLIASALDHNDGTPSELTLAVAEAIAAGARNIEIMRIASVSGEDPLLYPVIDRFDDLEEALDILKLVPVDIVHLAGAYVDEDVTGTSAYSGAARKGFHYLLADKLYQANKQGNTAIGVLGVKPMMQVADEESWDADVPTNRAEQSFNEPKVAYVREWVDHLSEDSGVLVDHSSETLLSGFLNGAAETSPGVVSSSYDLYAKDTSGSTATDFLGNNVDGGQFISIVAMAARVRHPDVARLAVRVGQEGNSDMNTNGAASYAGLITTLDPHFAPTNRIMGGVFAGRQMAAGLAEELMEYRYVTALDRPKGYVVAAATTAAYNASKYTRSDFVNLTTVRITHAAMDLVRLAAEEFIGGPISPLRMSAMEGAIQSSMNRLKAEGALRRADFVILTTPDMQVLGEAQIDLTLVPAFELRTVRVVTSLAKE